MLKRGSSGGGAQEGELIRWCSSVGAQEGMLIRWGSRGDAQEQASSQASTRKEFCRSHALEGLVNFDDDAKTSKNFANFKITDTRHNKLE